MSPPIPDQNALARCHALTTLIRTHQTTKGGTLAFSEFMALALYAEHLGYYNAKNPFGRHGDFITAPELSPLFAHCISETYQKVGGDFIEYGAGSGIFARDFLMILANKHALPQRYWIIETSPYLRSIQAHRLKTECPDLLERVHWTDAPPKNYHGMIFANELLDAVPFDCFEFKNNQFYERRVARSGDLFRFESHPASKPLKKHLALLPPLPEGYCSEIRPALSPLIHTMASCLKEGVLLLLDYGYGRAEYFHPERQTGTLRCFYQHHHHTDPFLWPGLQDITAHVDFTHVAETALTAGLSLTGFTTQAAFLLSSDLTKYTLPSHQETAETLWKHAQAIKTLTLPSEMGETIKVMALSPDPALTLPGFSFKERRQDL